MFCCLRTCMNVNLRKPNGAANRTNESDIHLDGTNAGPEVILLSNHFRITGTGGALCTAPLVQSKSYFEVKIQQSGSWSIGLATQQADLTKKIGGTDKDSWCLCADNATRHNNDIVNPVIATTTTTTTIATKETITNSNSINSILNTKAATAAGLIGIEDVQEDLLLTTGKSFATTDEQTIITTQPPQHTFPDEGDIVGVAFDHVELNFYFNGKNLDVPFRNVKGAVYPVVYVGNGAILDIILDNFHYGPPNGFDKIMLEQSLL